MTWIGYRKAYDSIPHSWILKTLRMYRFNEKVIRLMETSMNNWNTTMKLHYNDGCIITDPITRQPHNEGYFRSFLREKRSFIAFTIYVGSHNPCDFWYIRLHPPPSYTHHGRYVPGTNVTKIL